MKWASDLGTSSPPEVFTAVAPRGNRREGLCEMWAFFVDKIVPANAAVSWTGFRLEIWADTGRILLFPVDAARDDRVEKAGVCLDVPELLETWDQLSLLDESSFELAIAEELRVLASEILAAGRAARQVKSFTLPSVPVEVWDADEDTPIATGFV